MSAKTEMGNQMKNVWERSWKKKRHQRKETGNAENKMKRGFEIAPFTVSFSKKRLSNAKMRRFWSHSYNWFKVILKPIWTWHIAAAIYAAARSAWMIVAATSTPARAAALPTLFNKSGLSESCERKNPTAIRVVLWFHCIEWFDGN